MTTEIKHYDVAGVYRVALKTDNEACLGRWSDIAQAWLVGHVILGRIVVKDDQLTVLGKLSQADLKAAGCFL